MSKFNKSSNGKNKTTNKSGHVAYKMQDKEKLVSQVLTTFFGEPKYYGDNSKELIHLASTVDPEFVFQLAIYARVEFNLRSVSHVLTAILANREDGKKYVRDLINSIIVRPDDLTEIMACYISMFGKPVPNSLKKGIADQMNRMNEYGLAKYKGGSKSVSMKDLICITHPKPKSAGQSELFNKVLNDNLSTPYTWETELSERGNTKEVWEELIDSNKVGYMALLRNLRNILQAGVSQAHSDKVFKFIANPEQVAKSKQLPFRFFSAYKMLADARLLTNKLADYLEDAIEASIANMPTITGRTLIAIDSSGSMQQAISNKSTVRCRDIATLLASMANKMCEEAVVMSFDTSYKLLSFPRRNGVISNMQSIPNMGGGTNLKLPFRFMLESGQMFDRVIMFSDNEINHGFSHSSRWYYDDDGTTCQQYADKYRKKINPNLFVHAIDLQGYGTQQFVGNDKNNIIAGWSEKVLDFIHLAEEGIGTLVTAIEKY